MTITEAARRAQIVDAAISTIAEHGFASTSYSKIAKTAGLSSTGLISYHFTNKDELMMAVVTEAIGQIGFHMHQRMQSTSTPVAALETYIRGIVEFMRDHPRPMRALLQIFMGGAFAYGDAEERTALSEIERILLWGQETGEFRDFDLRVMATTIQRAVDGIPFVQQSDPDLDLDAWAAELVHIFTLATVREANDR